MSSRWFPKTTSIASLFNARPFHLKNPTYFNDTRCFYSLNFRKNFHTMCANYIICRFQYPPKRRFFALQCNQVVTKLKGKTVYPMLTCGKLDNVWTCMICLGGWDWKVPFTFGKYFNILLAKVRACLSLIFKGCHRKNLTLKYLLIFENCLKQSSVCHI